MNEKSFSRKMNKEAKAREGMLDDVLKTMENFSTTKFQEEKNQQKFKLEEIKYKTTIKELNDYIEIYKNKIDTLNSEKEKDDKELLSLRKKVLKNDADVSTLKSILELFIKEYGIDKVVEITKLDQNKIESYIEK